MKEILAMRFRVLILWLFAVLWLCGASCSAQSTFLPPSPREERISRSKAAKESKARELFTWANRENPRLRWNACLAGMAHERARQMVQTGSFGHRDSRTGKNPAWEMIRSCLPSRYMGENLTRGDESAALLHETLMKSPSHRGNILDRKYDQLGVGCYGEVCVQLFAGE